MTKILKFTYIKTPTDQIQIQKKRSIVVFILKYFLRNGIENEELINKLFFDGLKKKEVKNDETLLFPHKFSFKEIRNIYILLYKKKKMRWEWGTNIKIKLI